MPGRTEYISAPSDEYLLPAYGRAYQAVAHIASMNEKACFGLDIADVMAKLRLLCIASGMMNEKRVRENNAEMQQRLLEVEERAYQAKDSGRWSMASELFCLVQQLEQQVLLTKIRHYWSSQTETTKAKFELFVYGDVITQAVLTPKDPNQYSYSIILEKDKLEVCRAQQDSEVLLLDRKDQQRRETIKALVQIVVALLPTFPKPQQNLGVFDQTD